MKYLDEFSNREVAQKFITKIKEASSTEIKLMEVCGTHTVAIFRSGIQNLIPKNISLLSGPGCPVCVTPNKKIDYAIALSREKDVILATFGDMMRVPGSSSSLTKEMSNGSDIHIVYSTMDALKIAQENPSKKVVFFAIGFETTSPTVAASILEAEKLKIRNYYIIPAHKLIPPAMEALLETKELGLDGFICPGHVSTIIGIKPYESISQNYHIPCVITGFEPLDILQSIYFLVKQKEGGLAKVENQYKRCVRKEGNQVALKMLDEVFEIDDSEWRGMGVIRGSGLKLREEYLHFDAEQIFQIETEEPRVPSGCLCGDVLRGIKIPLECPLFDTICTPEDPQGACMVSAEGSCAAYYKYSRRGMR
jgi:hydrogenase expression/formation protein HypD